MPVASFRLAGWWVKVDKGVFPCERNCVWEEGTHDCYLSIQCFIELEIPEGAGTYSDMSVASPELHQSHYKKRSGNKSYVLCRLVLTCRLCIFANIRLVSRCQLLHWPWMLFFRTSEHTELLSAGNIPKIWGCIDLSILKDRRKQAASLFARLVLLMERKFF